MKERIVVTSRQRPAERPKIKEFQFNQDMVPIFSGDGKSPSFLREYRMKAWEAFQQLPMPHTSSEPWRRTDLRGLDAGSFRLPKPGEYEKLSPVPKTLLEPLAGDMYGGQIIMMPGGVRVNLSDELSSKGVIFTDLKTAEQKYEDILSQIIGKTVKHDEGKFAALAAALSQNGVLIYVPQGVQVEQPLHTALWGPGVGLAHFSHIMVWLEKGASLTYVHEDASLTESEGQTLHAGIVEIHLGDRANLRFVELQSWGENVWNFSHERARVGREANLDWIFGAVGSHLTKNFSDLDLIGEGANGRMSGFYFADGKQHLDHDTQQNHLAANTTSDLLYKGALKGNSRSVWQGMIYVAPEAQKTDGYQANRNMILSDKARADSIPGLEIMADDVRCTHGATVGKIDPDEIFYLRSRGIPYQQSVRLIVEGFFDPIMQRIPLGGVRSRLQEAISTKMEG
jgi:Fe-S cluster assembly protein SufD